MSAFYTRESSRNAHWGLLVGCLSVSALNAQAQYAQPPTLIAAGSTTITQGNSVSLTAKPNLALSFSGSNYVATNLNAQPSAMPTTTWEAWVYPTTTNAGTRQTIMTIDDGGWDRGVIIEASTANFAVFTGTSTIWQPATVDLNTWQHIAVVYTSSGVTFYKNGVAYTYSGAYSLSSTANQFNIGRNPGFGEYFRGQIDEVRVWNTARAQSAIQSTMSAPPAGSTTGLMGSWRFNEGSGTTATDLTGTYPGSLFGSPAYVTPGQASIGAATFAWTPTTGLNTSTAATVVASPTATTAYSVAVTAPGTNSSATQVVTVNPAPSLTVSTTTSVPAGSYTNLVVASGGVATLSGATTIYGAVTVQAGGTLLTNCQALTGTGDFTLAAGGTLGICDAAGIASSGATGAVQTTGARSFSPDASYVYNGTAAQATGLGLPATVRNLSTTNNSAVTLSAPTGVTQVVTIGAAGSLVANGNLTLLSSASATALVVNSGTGSVSGSTTVQRYVDPSLNAGLGYRHLSSPVAGSTVADLTTGTFTPEVSQASGYNTSATPGTTTPFPTVFGYDQGRVTLANSYAPFDRGFVVPASTSTPLAPGSGYTVNLAGGQVVDFVGQPTTGTSAFTLPRAAAAEAGWHLLGNPYPAPLDYSLVAPADRVGFDAPVYVYGSTTQYTGTYRAYVNGVGGNPVLPLGQAFFVRVSAGQTSGTFTFRNSQRLTAPENTPLQRPTADPRPLVQLELRGSTGPVDAYYAYAETGATPGTDAEFDAVKLPNPTGLNLSSVAATGEALAIDGRPAFTAATVLPLLVGVPAAGTYALRAAALNNLPTGLDAYLADDQTGQLLKLSAGTSYSFSVTAAQATALLSGRFRLSFRPATALATVPSLTAEAVGVYPNPAHERFTVTLPGLAQATTVQAELLNTLGQVVRRQSAALPATGTQFTLEIAGLATGVYTLRLQAGATTLAKRVVIH
jgi:hypothetical protein